MRGTAFGLLLVSAGSGAADEPARLERVEIVGSRVPRLDAETALPVQVIRRADIERSGASTVEELLTLVSANFGGFTEALGLGNGDTPGLSGASLRGLGTGETLVLLNGRRLANYAFTSVTGPGVDLHVIPLAAIERVEVLKDGASALYGSDAIGGVINFVTRQDYAGAELGVGYRATEAGGGNRGRATFAAGTGAVAIDGFNVFGVLDLQKTHGLRATDRSFAATSYRPELGLVSVPPSSFPANIRTPGGLVNPAAPGCTADTINLGRACHFDFARTLDLVAPSATSSFLGRGSLRVSPETTAYAEVLAATSRVEYRSSPAPGNPAGQQNTSIRLPATSPYYPSGLGLAGDLSLSYRTAPLGSRVSEVESSNVRVLAGAKSRVAEWDVDGALSYNDSRSKESYLGGYVDAVRLSEAIGSGLVNPFGDSAPEGQALLAGTAIHGKSRSAVGRTYGGDLRGTRELMTLPGGPVGMATGIEARHETLRDEQTALAGDVLGGGPGAPKHGTRNAQAAYVELVAPVGNGIEIQGAARVDHYSDFGTSVSPKVALRWQLAPTVLLRASAGRGFRAPSLPELYTQQTSGSIEFEDVSDPVRCPVTGSPSDCQLAVLAVNGGNPALKPQRSTQFNAGLVVEVAKSWLVSVDVWSIRVHDVIGMLSLDDVLADIPLYDGKNVVRGPVDPAFPALPGPIVRIETLNENLGDWRVDGADLSFSLKPIATPLGLFSFRFDGTYVRRARQNIFVGNTVDLIGAAVPRWQQVLSMNLDRGPWTGTLSHRYRRGYPDRNELPDGSTRQVESFRMLDGHLGYAFTKDVRMTLDVHNLLDRDPPFTNGADSFQVGYNPAYADPLGRTYTLTLRAAWR